MSLPDGISLPEYLYHGTSDGYLDSILKNGLDPKCSADGFLCYTDDWTTAEYHAQHMAEYDEGVLDRPCRPLVITIPIERFQTDEFCLDANFIRLGPSHGRASGETLSDRDWEWHSLLAYAGAVGYRNCMTIATHDIATLLDYESLKRVMMRAGLERPSQRPECVVPELLQGSYDRAGYPITDLTHVRVYDTVALTPTGCRGQDDEGPNAYYTDGVLMNTVRANHEKPYPAYAISAYRRVEAGCVLDKPLDGHRQLQIPCNGTRLDSGSIAMGVKRITRPLKSWRHPADARVAITERVLQGLYRMPFRLRKIADNEHIERFESLSIDALRQDLATAFSKRKDVSDLWDSASVCGTLKDPATIWKNYQTLLNERLKPVH